MNRTTFNLEKTLFVFINIFFSFCLLTFFVSKRFSYWLSITVNHTNPVTSEQDGYYVSWIILFWFFYILSKSLIFAVLYSLKKVFPYMNRFLSDFKNKNHFRKTVFKKAFILDIFAYVFSTYLFFVSTQNYVQSVFYIFGYSALISILWGGGVTTNYLIFLSYAKMCSLWKKKKHLFCRAS